jgi:hypothetical protein
LSSFVLNGSIQMFINSFIALYFSLLILN